MSDQNQRQQQPAPFAVSANDGNADQTPPSNRMHPNPTTPRYADYHRAVQAQHQRSAYHHYIAQQRMMQQQYAAYIQQQQYQYYSHYGYPAMQQSPAMGHYAQSQYAQSPFAQRAPPQYTGDAPRSAPIMLSSEEQPLLMPSADREDRSERRRKRKRTECDDEEHAVVRSETVSLDLSDEEQSAGGEHDGYDRFTLIHRSEHLPAIDEEFDDWLCFSKKLWKRQRKHKERAASIDLLLASDAISTSIDSADSTSPKGFGFKSAFLEGRMSSKRSVLRKRKVVDLMMKMGLAPPWSAMWKYKEWSKCFEWNTAAKNVRGGE